MKTNTDHTGLKGGDTKRSSAPTHQTHQSMAKASKQDPSGSSKGNPVSATLGLKGASTSSAARTVSSVKAPDLPLGGSFDPQQSGVGTMGGKE